MSRFVGIPAVPLTDDVATTRVLLALKENVELLTDQRGESDRASVALLATGVTVPQLDAIFRTMTARGSGVYINNTAVPMQSDYVKLLQDFQLLAADVAAIRTTLNLLISQLRNQ